MGRVLVGALAIVLASTSVGIIANHFSPRGIPIIGRGEELHLPLPQGISAMSIYQAHAASKTGTAVLIDARPSDRYATSHVPDAVNLPPDAFEEKYPDLAPQIEAAGSAIVYCEGTECSDSIFVAERIREVFSGPVSVVETGWPAWVLAGYPITSGEQP